MNDNRMLSVDQNLMEIDAKLAIRGMWQSVRHTVFGAKQTTLLSLDAYRGNREILEKSNKGNQAIPVKQIKGSVNGHADYDADFYPLNSARASWEHSCRKFLNGEAMPVISVVKVDDIYLVEDGHAAVSVARVLGYSFLDAQVTEVELGPIHNQQEASRDMVATSTLRPVHES